MAGFRMRDLNLTSGGNAQRVRAMAVTPELFDVLGVQPELGRRFFDSDVQQQGAPRVALLSHTLWQSRFGADRDIVGRHLELEGADVEIVGVMPERVVFPDPSASTITSGFSGLREAQLWVPLWLDPQGNFGDFGTSTVARLTPGATLDQARQEIEALQRRLPERFKVPQSVLNGWGWSVSVERLRDSIVGDMARVIWILFGTVGFVLLVAGANVANLFLVRMEARWGELSVRSALGASRGRLARGVLIETVVFALAGGAVGLLMATAGIRWLFAYGPVDLPRLHEVHIDGRVVLFTLALSLLAGVVLCTLVIARLSSRGFGALPLDASRGTTPGRERHRVRRALIVGQIALALVLLVGSGLMLRSAARLYTVDPGLTVENLLTAGVSVGARDRARAVVLYHRILDEVAGLPNITTVGAANILPFEATRMSGSGVAIQSRSPVQNQIRPIARYKAVTAGYFETMRMPLLEGRAPVRADADQNHSVVWVNETFVRTLLAGRTVGEHLTIEGRALEIVGVVGDVREFGLREEVRPTAYLPLGVIPSVGHDIMYVVARTGAAAPPSASALRAAVDRVDPSVPTTAVRMMNEIVGASLAPMSFTMTLLMIAASVAVLLAVIGLYAVARYMVSQRTHEIGVRLALGAQPREVRIMILRQNLAAGLLGVVLGLLTASALTRVLSSLLFDVSAHDWVTFGAAAIAITTVSVVATYLSTRRATRVDPVVALRYE
jgi:putative ABC transport system permease protein